MNYRNDLDECIAYFKLPSEYAQFFNIVFWVALLAFALQLHIRQTVPKAARELWYCILHEHYKTTIFLHKCLSLETILQYQRHISSVQFP